ncbi:MAG: filamentous hemagglutinin N-terminal domain-containing protein [Cyanobacteria bacterium J06650_10]
MSNPTAKPKRVLIKRPHVLYSSLFLGYGLFAAPATAQSITVDGSTPTTLSNGPSGCTGTCTLITGGSQDGNGTGSNLFHSFSNFNVEENSTVTFEDPGATNIFSRVTGSTPSNIEGKLSVEGQLGRTSTANLFLINSHGILFSDTAELNIGGSFLATTSESFLFENNGQFSTTDPSQIPSLLTVSTPIGIQFGVTPGQIELRGTGNNLLYSSRGIRRNFFTPPTSGLSVPTGESIALLGSDIRLQGSNLIAENGQIEVGSIGSNEFVAFTDKNSQWQFGYDQVSGFREISLSELSGIDVSGSDAGSIHLQGRQISVEGGSALLAQVTSSGNGNIVIDASEKLQLTGVNLAPPPNGPFMQSSIYVEIASTATGDGNSSLIVNSPNIDIRDGAQIGLTMAGAGQAGNLQILEAETISVDGLSNVGPSSIFTTVAPLPNTSATARGGNLTIDTEEFFITNGANIAANTFGPGQGGNLQIDADTIQVTGFGIANTPTGPITVPTVIETASLTSPDDLIGRPSSAIPSGNGSGSSGSATLNTRQLLVADGGQIRTGTNSNNPAGELVVDASESVELSGRTSDGRSGIFSSAREGSGTGGSITVDTPQLSILNGATINAGNFPSSDTSSRTDGTGPAGNITLKAQSILLNNDGLITADTVMGDRANVTIRTEDIILRNGSEITTDATGTASGGNISIDATALIALENSDITANAESNTGGRIIINAQTILGTAYREAETDESDITATSALGPAFSGSVELNTPDVSPTDGLTNLPPDPASTEQIVAACEQLGSNTFVATGRGGMPEDGSQLVVGESIWNDFRLLENQTIESFSGSVQNKDSVDNTTDNKLDSSEESLRNINTLNLVEAQTWFVNDSGQVVLGTQASSALQQSANCLSQV